MPTTKKYEETWEVAFWNILAAAVFHSDFQQMSLADFVRALHLAEAEHIVRYGRPIYVASRVADKMGKALMAEYDDLSVSELKCALAAFQTVYGTEGKEEEGDEEDD